MKYKLISSLAFLMILYSSFAQDIRSNYHPRYYASVQTIYEKIQKGLLMQVKDSSIILYPGKWKELHKGVIRDSIVIRYAQIQQIKLRKKNGVLKGLMIGGGIGLAPIFFGQGGGYVAIFSFPLGVITGSIVGSTSSKKYTIKGSYAAFSKMREKIK